MPEQPECTGHYERRPTRDQSDKLADILWWIQGALDTDSLTCSFNRSHIEALRAHRAYAQFDKDGEWALDV